MTRDEIVVGKTYLVAGSQNPIRVTRHQEGAQTPVVRGVQRLWRRDRWYGVDVITGRTTRFGSASSVICEMRWWETCERWWKVQGALTHACGARVAFSPLLTPCSRVNMHCEAALPTKWFWPREKDVRFFETGPKELP